MVSLKEQRERQVKELVKWLKAEYPNILKYLREKTYWHYDEDKRENVELTFDQLFEADKNEAWALMGVEVLKVLRSHIWNTFAWSGKTKRDYLTTVMHAVGCRYVSRVWYCPLTFK